jgi:peptidylprolyl isomerase
VAAGSPPAESGLAAAGAGGLDGASAAGTRPGAECEEHPVAEPTRPDVEPPTGPAPDDLVVEDLVVGDGAEATRGSLVRAHYVGVTHDGGEQFDASWDRGDPLEFQLGVGMVIQGWDEGIEGMKVGGRRRLTIPPHKAYGERGAGGVIKPGATLVFVVDLVGVR